MKLFQSRKGQTLSKTGILLIVIVFYAVLITLIGYINSYYAQTINPDTADATTNTELNFLGMIITGISELPVWINFILFGSLTIIVGWLIITSLPLWNGGS
jgi:hypothetical protein